MPMITNKSAGVRMVNAKPLIEDPNDPTRHERISIAPGEEVDAELFDPGNPVYHGWANAGEVVFAEGALKDATAVNRKRGPMQQPKPAEPAATGLSGAAAAVATTTVQPQPLPPVGAPGKV